ncbi:FkbM family methyltransferase [Mycolicibacterium gilvum]|uniref:FkbM family methyltransferase n=1 Tax=Mycolicibacterium gilvum TaxID=1804 RepID=UPI004045AEEB
MAVDMSAFSRSTLGAIPFGIGLGSRKMRLVQGIADWLARGENPTEFPTRYGTIQIDWGHKAERALPYCFSNFDRHYRRSPLGQYIASRQLGGKTFVDIGANLGMYSFLARAGGASVYMFEPEPSHVKFLARNSEILGSLFPIALSDTRGQLPLYYNPENPGATSLVESDGFIAADDAVPVSTFSEIQIEQEDLIDLVKIDVEGNEVRTVCGMESFLARGNRPDIWCEVRGDAGGRSPGSYRGVIDFLTDFGYEPSDGTYAPISSCPSRDVLDKRGVFDLLFKAEM